MLGWGETPSEYRNIEISKYRNIGISKYRNIEISKYRNIGISEYRNIGISNDDVLILGYANSVDLHIGLHPILTYAALSGLFIIHY
jgi:hypothetical protein